MRQPNQPVNLEGGSKKAFTFFKPLSLSSFWLGKKHKFMEIQALWVFGSKHAVDVTVTQVTCSSSVALFEAIFGQQDICLGLHENVPDISDISGVQAPSNVSCCSAGPGFRVWDQEPMRSNEVISTCFLSRAVGGLHIFEPHPTLDRRK